MKRIAPLFLILVLASLSIYAHGTDSHSILGTVKAVEGNTLVVTSTEGKIVTAELTSDTRYTRGTEEVSREALTAGTRVSVKLTHDNRKVVSIRMAAKK
jgi:hypothetical protein